MILRFANFEDQYLEVIEWLFSYGPQRLYLTLECNIGPRRPPESNIGTNTKCIKQNLKNQKIGNASESLIQCKFLVKRP